MIYVIVVLWGTTPAPLVDVGNMHGLLLENLSRKENMSIPLYLYIYNCPDATGAVNYYYDDGPLEIASPIKRTHTSNPKKTAGSPSTLGWIAREPEWSATSLAACWDKVHLATCFHMSNCEIHFRCKCCSSLKNGERDKQWRIYHRGGQGSSPSYPC